MHSPDALLRRMFDAMVASAQPERCVAAQLPALDTLRGGRVIVIGAGKASAAMAQAVESRWDGPLTGLVVTRHGYAAPCARIEIVEAAHPVPDEAGLRAARRMLDLVSGLRPEDTVLCLISGGGSALLPLPLDGLTLRDKQAVNRALLASGATISDELRAAPPVRDQGGRLAAACHPARVITLLLMCRATAAGHRVRPHLRRSHHLRRRAGHRAAPASPCPRPRWTRCARPRRVRQARRSAPGARRDPHGGHAADGAGGGRRRGAPGRLRRPHPRRRAGGRGARRRQGARRHRVAGRRARTAVPPACCCRAAKPP